MIWIRTPDVEATVFSKGFHQPVTMVVTGFDRICIPPDCVPPRSHTPGTLPQIALPDGRIPISAPSGTFAKDCWQPAIRIAREDI